MNLTHLILFFFNLGSAVLTSGGFAISNDTQTCTAQSGDALLSTATASDVLLANAVASDI